jgi:hypothetical protein
VSDFDVKAVLPRPRCLHCADIIGAYEPMVLETPHGARRTSLAAEPELYGSDAPCFHRACYAEVNALDF